MDEIKPTRVSQEFYCGECRGYFIIRLNAAIDHEVLICCPNCQHEHQRCVKNGKIFEQGRFNSEVKEKILTTSITYRKTPIIKPADFKFRDGNVLSTEQQERWLEIAQREKTGKEFEESDA